MKTSNLLLVVSIILGALGIGAWLVIQGHPWFGLMAMIIAASSQYKEES